MKTSLYLRLTILFFFALCVYAVSDAKAKNYPQRNQIITDALDLYEYGAEKRLTNDRDTVSFDSEFNSSSENSKPQYPAWQDVDIPLNDSWDDDAYHNDMINSQKDKYHSYRSSYNEKKGKGNHDWVQGAADAVPREGRSPRDSDSFMDYVIDNLDFGYVQESNQKPKFYAETVFPLAQTTDRRKTLFSHSRISKQSRADITYSTGIGYRRLMFDDTMLGGMNAFFDYQNERQHYRMGYGVELESKDWEARFNYYDALSPARKITENTSTQFFEQAVDGFDMEFGGPFPSISWLKLFGGYVHYDQSRAESLDGWKARAEIDPLPFLTLNLETFDSQLGSKNYRMDARVSLFFDSFRPKDLLAAFKMSDDEEYEEEGDLSEQLISRMLDRVERDFNIQVEKWNSSTPLPVGSGGDIQVQLIWDNSNDNDMDLHMNLPVGNPTHVFWSDPKSLLGGELFAELDVDDIPPHGTHPGRDHVENIFVVQGRAVPGTYGAYVHTYYYDSDVTATINVYVDGQLANSYSHTFTFDGEIFNLPDIIYP